MTTTQILEEVKAVRDKYAKKSFNDIKVIKTIYTVAYIICVALLAYVCFDSPIFANENNPLLGGIAVTMAALLFYFVLRFNMSGSDSDYIFLSLGEYGVGKCVWRYIVTAIMTFIFSVMLFTPRNSPDIIITNVTKEIAVGKITIEVSGIVLYFVMIGLAVVSHIICVVLWNKARHNVYRKLIPQIQSTVKIYTGKNIKDDIVRSIVLCVETYLAESKKNPNSSLLIIHDEVEKQWKKVGEECEHEESPELMVAKERFANLLNELCEIERENDYKAAQEEWKRQEIRDLRDEASKLNDQLKDLKDELDRYK
ncbi:MAG: hypothetical protein J6D11_08215 [Clostridia bacterium]|nr:hypothetical protein [Clostridia bacterium]